MKKFSVTVYYKTVPIIVRSLQAETPEEAVSITLHDLADSLWRTMKKNSKRNFSSRDAVYTDVLQTHATIVKEI